MKTNLEFLRTVKGYRNLSDPGKILIAVYLAGILIFVLIGGFTRAFANTNDDYINEIALDEVNQGELLFAGSETNGYHKAPLLKQNVELNVSGMIVNTLVRQHFKNTRAEWMEAVYVFPLPDESAITRMRMVIGERVIIGEVKEKQEARRTYESARQEGKKTSLLAQKRPNIFTMAVANIPPHETIVVEIEYLDTVHYDSDVFSLRFPMVIGPRYIPGTPVSRPEKSLVFDEAGWAVDTDQVGDAAQITPEVVPPSEMPINPVTLKLNLNPGFPVRDLNSLYHGVEKSRISDASYVLQFNGRIFADRDFVVEYRAANARRITASLFNETLNGENYAYFMLMPPTDKITVPPPRDVIFVLDKSGSMAGTSIRQAKKAMEFAISRLTSQDRFNVIVFNNRASRYFKEPQPANAKHKDKALAKVTALDAEGGTEIASALHLALDGEADRGRIRQVIFLTDGAVGNEKALFELITTKLGDTRLFTVGIGTAPNTYFMSRAAARGRGSFTYIGKIEEVSSKMTELFEKLENPVVTDLSIQANRDATVELYPSPLPDLYQGEPLVGVVKASSPVDSLIIQGMSAGKAWSVELNNDAKLLNPGVATLWARKKIRSLMAVLKSDGEAVDLRKQIIETAIHHHLVTKFTSLVAVEQKVSRPVDQDLKTGQVKSNMPKGWQHGKVFGTSSRTATHSQAAVSLGVIVLLLGLLLLRNTTKRRIP